MPHAYTRFAIREAALIAAFNAAMNVSYTWFLWRGLSRLSLFGEHGVGLDLALTPAFIGLLSTLLGTASLRRRLAAGQGAYGTGAPMLRLLPGHVAARSAVLALGCGVVFSLPVWAMLQLRPDAALTLVEALGAKAAITIVLSMVIVPVVVACALADLQRDELRLAPV